MCIIRLANASESLLLRICGRTKPESQDFWDANWLGCSAEVCAGAFSRQVDRSIRNQDLDRFMNALEVLDGRAGEALLDTLDGWLDVRVKRDEQGNVEARCELADNPVGGNQLEFHLTLDRTTIPALVAQLREVLERFPVVGLEE